MKVLHVSGAKSWGGNEQQMIDLISELNKLGVENTVLGVGNSPLEKECSRQNISFIICKKTKLNKFANYGYLKQLVSELKTDIIHLHTSDALTVYTISDLLFRLKTPTVFSKKGMGNSSSILSKYKYNYKNLSAIVCVSEKVKSDFSKILNRKTISKLMVIYDGISVNRIQEPKYDLINNLKINNKESHIIGNIANHVRAKDLRTLMLMMNELVNVLGERNVHLIQIGNFKDKITIDIQKLINDNNLSNNVTLTGFLEDASSFISQFDVYVMSSEREGLPLTVYEAFYKKTPIVSTKAGGIPETIIDGKNGYLVDVKDYKNLAVKTKQLLYDEKLKNQFRKKSYELFVAKFTAEKCAQNTITIYNKMKKQKNESGTPYFYL
jgi:glycosyltransferase involved in cell wall biosynthesis